MAATRETIQLDDVDHVATNPGRSGEPRIPALAVGVIVWLSSELMFFSGLFAASFTLRAKTAVWPPAGVELGVGRAAIFTVVLIISSFTLHLAVAAARRDDRVGAVRWLGVTLILGTLFVANQGLEYADASFSISSHAYGSMFYLLTGFHGLHVIGGLLLMGAAVWMISGSTSRAPKVPTMEMCAYYWHFVDLVWVVMFANIYLIK
ncbi:MAG: heme-copper oxidase subunit III [Ilumatobacteraceae bacterium]